MTRRIRGWAYPPLRSPWWPLLAVMVPFVSLTTGLILLGQPLVPKDDPRYPSRQVVSAADFPRGPGETSDLPRLKRLLTALTSADGYYGPGGCEVLLPPGDYELDDTLEFSSLGSVYFRGGGTGTRFRYTGPPNQPCMIVSNCYRCSFERFMILTQVESSVGLLVTNKPNARTGWVTTACRFVELQIGGEYGGTFDVGVNTDNTALGGPDANDEDHEFDGVTTGNYATAGFRQAGENVHQILYRGCKALGNTHTPNGRYGVLAAHSCFFSWERGYMNGHEYDFMLADFQVNVRIRDFNGENSCGFLRTGGPTGSPLPTLVEGIRWDGVPKSPDGADAHAVVHVINPGPFTMRNCRFSSQNGVWPLFWLGTFVPGTYVLESNHIANLRDPGKPPALWGNGGAGSFLRTAGNILQNAVGDTYVTH